MLNMLKGLVTIGVIVLTVSQVAGQTTRSTTTCNVPKSNVQGVSRADVVVTDVPATVLAVDANRCSALLRNTGAADVRCASDNEAAPSPTAGTLIPTGQGLGLGVGEATRLWRCVRVASTDSAVNVLEVSTK